jgi:UDP-2,3-diacylglucosamine pyrophosphatase LpxH
MLGVTEPIRVRTLFISDVHLGTKGAQAELLLAFLDRVEAETIFIVGDLVDGWQLKKKWYWPQTHTEVLQKIMRRGSQGTRIIYIPGNHDEFLRDYVGSHFGVVELMLDAIHVTADGRKFLVMHGDEFDVVVGNAKWLAHLGDWAYVAAMQINKVVNLVRRRLGFTYWSLSAWAKSKVKSAVNAIGSFETTLSDAAKRRGVEGIICGHIHTPALTERAGLTYVNTGDWVESCTAVLEHPDGRLELVYWRALIEARPETAETMGKVRSAA